MNKNIQRSLEGIKVGAKQSHENMTLYCLLKADDTDVDFLTLDEAVDFIDGELAGMELLDKFDTFRKNHSKLVHSYVMDALETASFEAGAESKTSKARAAKILESTADATVEKRKSVALGEDIRLESREVVGAGLECEEQVLQLSIFPNTEPKESGRIARSIR